MMTLKIRYLGHASFKFESDGKIVFVDPWLSGPTSPLKVEDVDKADFCLVTHDHGDHGYAEAVDICKKTGAYFIAINELALKAKGEGIENVHTLNIGGSITVDGVTITLVQAFHSCGIGAPTGFVVRFSDGKTIYHPGDTGVFASMELIGRLYQPDVVCLPIGSYYVSDCKQAALAVELIRPKVAIPMHYDTFPVISADPNEFKQLVADMKLDTKIEIIAPGESMEL
ncbi:MAG: metal-dependent hydrolase [Candidatus Thorarchaeota archaeon]|jgi:L-ascorbate metabolism protein UlaG (beta-lactamase superfamily)